MARRSPDLHSIETVRVYIKPQSKKMDLYGKFRDGSYGHLEHDTDELQIKSSTNRCLIELMTVANRRAFQ